MPDHVHLVLTPLDAWTISAILRRVKGDSSRRVNSVLGRKGALWQDESFDRIMRRNEDIRRKCEYVCENPVRATLVTSVAEYKWLWRDWVEGRQSCLPVNCDR